MKNLNSILFLLLSIWSSGIVLAQSVDIINDDTVYVSQNTLVAIVGDFHNESTGEWINDGENSFQGNLTNEGIMESYNTGSLIRFEGNRVQEIKGVEDIFIKNLIFNNTSEAVPFKLFAELYVEGEVQFGNGIINNSNYGGKLFLANGSSHIGAGEGKYVNGPVMGRGHSKLTFPVGDRGHYGYVELSNLKPEALYEAQYYQADSDALHSHAKKADEIRRIDHAQYWTIATNDNTPELMLSLPWEGDVTPAFLLEDLEALHIVRWDESNAQWVDQGGTVDYARGTISTQISEVGIFALANVKAEEKLPCGLEIFNAITPNSDGKNDFFSIRGQDGTTDCFQKIGVQIFDKLGAKVFEASDYGWARPGGVFIGQHNVGGRQKKEKLPSGNYFYVLDIDYLDTNGNPKTINKTGYLYLKDE